MFNKKLLIGIAIGLVLIVFGCIVVTSGTWKTIVTNFAISQLKVSSVKMDTISNNLFIVGTMKNTSKKSFTYVSIKYDLFNQAGAFVGNAQDNINSLKPERIWLFHAIILGNQTVTSYKIHEISAKIQ